MIFQADDRRLSCCSAFYNTTIGALTEAAPALCNRLLPNCRGHNVRLLESVRDPAARLWYAHQAIERGRARPMRQIGYFSIRGFWHSRPQSRRPRQAAEVRLRTQKRLTSTDEGLMGQDCFPGPVLPYEDVAYTLHHVKRLSVKC